MHYPPAAAVDSTPRELDPSAAYLRTLSDETRAELKDNFDVLLGEQILNLIRGDDITDIWRNSNGSIFVIGAKTPVTEITLDVEHADAHAMGLITAVSSAYRVPINENNPQVSRMLPWYDVRFTGVLPPYTDGPLWVIRIFRAREATLDGYVATGRAKQYQIDAIRTLIRQNKNILVIGSQGHGKTTAVDAILDEVGNIYPDTRFGVLQDANEIRLRKHRNRFYLYASTDEPIVSYASLIKLNLRLTGASVTLGELREQAFAAMDLWSTGTTRTGCATIHGTTEHEGLRRYEILLRRDGLDINLETRDAIHQAIGGVLVLSEIKGLRGCIVKVARIAEATAVGYRFEDVL